MMIAMKSYLFLPLFFLGILFFPNVAFTQQNPAQSSTHQPQKVPSNDSLLQDHQNEMEFRNDVYHEEIPSTWGDHHVEKESDTFQSKFFNMLFILGLLICFMMLASWALKRLMRTKITNLNTASNIKVIETRYLSPRATLYLVEVLNQTFLIAESPTTVTTVATLPVDEGEEHTSV